MTVFEVWTDLPLDEEGNATGVLLETRRSDRKVAEHDVELLKLFGKSAWIKEVGYQIR